MCGPKGLAGSHNALFRGNGDGTFSDVSEKAGLLKARPAYGFTPLVLDYDNDRLARCLRGQRFQRVAAVSQQR